ncbi:hypothetical protein PIROE2DRAFT_68384 [Piromyces sp. E2]|nr:hypothetical protein PIROE2DRAFT_68384 [Piromyces sp. E2]|eukprot:OUM70650.1 hypothetical protein PIROE2DRAFT_68384 [Piromyces sp. E2]
MDTSCNMDACNGSSCCDSTSCCTTKDQSNNSTSSCTSSNCNTECQQENSELYEGVTIKMTKRGKEYTVEGHTFTEDECYACGCSPPVCIQYYKNMAAKQKKKTRSKSKKNEKSSPSKRKKKNSNSCDNNENVINDKKDINNDSNNGDYSLKEKNTNNSDRCNISDKCVDNNKSKLNNNCINNYQNCTNNSSSNNNINNNNNNDNNNSNNNEFNYHVKEEYDEKFKPFFKKDDTIFNKFPYNNDFNSIPVMNMNVKKEFDFDDQKLLKNNLPFLHLPPFKIENNDLLKLSPLSGSPPFLNDINKSSNSMSFLSNLCNNDSSNSMDELPSSLKLNRKGKHRMKIDELFAKNGYQIDINSIKDEDDIEEAIKKMEESIKVEVKDEPSSKKSKKSNEDEDMVVLEKRRKNTEAARRSRMRKVLKIMNLEKKVKLLEEKNSQLSLYVAKQQQEKELFQQNYSNILNSYYFLQKKMERTKEVLSENKYRLPPDVIEKLNL